MVIRPGAVEPDLQMELLPHKPGGGDGDAIRDLLSEIFTKAYHIISLRIIHFKYTSKLPIQLLCTNPFFHKGSNTCKCLQR